MKRVAKEIAADEPRIDVLMNNAGAMFSKRHLTEDGLERTFASESLILFRRYRRPARAPAGDTRQRGS